MISSFSKNLTALYLGQNHIWPSFAFALGQIWTPPYSITFKRKLCTIKSHSIFSISYVGCVDEVPVSVQHLLRSLLRNLNFIFTYSSSCWHDMVHVKCWIWVLKISIENQRWNESVWYEFLRLTRKGGWRMFDVNS